MTELDRVCSSGVFNCFCKCTRNACGQREKGWNVCTVMILLNFQSNRMGVRFAVCHVVKT